jgi:hypothetical protein
VQRSAASGVQKEKEIQADKENNVYVGQLHLMQTSVISHERDEAAASSPRCPAFVLNPAETGAKKCKHHTGTL